ncbi:MAG: serine protease/subtilase, partial [Bdellovibrio sp.]
APGQDILSTVPGDAYAPMTGTSQATAFVTGAAVLVMSVHPEFSASEVKKYILQNGDSKPSLQAKTKTARLLNMRKALTSLDSDISVSGIRVVNTNLNQTRYTAEASLPGDSVSGSILRFGKSLMQAVTSSGASETPPPDKTFTRVGTKN